MAQIGSNNTFTYNGQAYFFQATIFTRTEKYFSMHGLDSDECIQFEYYNQINSLAIPAILTYEDRYGLIDKYLEKPYVLCSITFGTVETEIKDGVINYKTLSDEALLNMDFLVSKIEIVKRSKVRRNNLSYLRARSGKSARLAAKDFDRIAVNDVTVEEPEEAPKAEEAPAEPAKEESKADGETNE